MKPADLASMGDELSITTAIVKKSERDKFITGGLVPWTALGEQDYIFTFVYRKRTGEKLHEGGRQLISKIASPCVPLTGGKQNAPGLRLCAGPGDSDPLHLGAIS